MGLSHICTQCRKHSDRRLKPFKQWKTYKVLFCSFECRKLWSKERRKTDKHQLRIVEENYERYIRSFGPPDCDGNATNDDEEPFLEGFSLAQQEAK